jgi:hypothetical protein
MSSVEPFALLDALLLRSCWRRLFGDRGSGEPRFVVVPRGDERKRGKPKEEEGLGFGLRLNDILSRYVSVGNN